MRQSIRLIAAALAGIAAIGLTAASAAPRGGDRVQRNAPVRCDVDHDHRAHDANYYDFYEQDRYYRAGPYRSSGVSFSVTLGDGYDDRRDRYDDRYGRNDRYDDRYDRRGARGYRQSRVIKKRSYDTRYRARIFLTEEVYYGPRHDRIVCTVSVRGPDSRYVPNRQIRRIARNECSRRAEVRILA